MAELLQREQQYTPLWQQSGRSLNFHRWAGFSGAIAVITFFFVSYIKTKKFQNFLIHLFHERLYLLHMGNMEFEMLPLRLEQSYI